MIVHGWAENFSYEYFKEILKILNSRYSVKFFYEFPRDFVAKENKPLAFLRHDIDISIGKALEMAKMESESGVYSTYMVMTNSLLYSIDDEEVKENLLKIQEMGHDIGLQFNVWREINDKEKLESFNPEIESQRKKIEKIVGSQVRSLSFHRPHRNFIGGPLTIGGMVNSYAAEFMKWYMSDSKGQWRNGEPIPRLKNPENSVLQILIHPIWWGDRHMSAANRLEKFFKEKVKGKTRTEVGTLDNALSKTLSIVRSGKDKM